MLRLVVFQTVFVVGMIHGLSITEVFYKGCQAVRSEERFIEILNDGAVPFDLSALTVSVPKSDTATVELTVEKGDFGIRQNDVITDSMNLLPGSFAVIMTEDYQKYAKLLSFSPGTMVLKPRTKSFSGWSWAGRVALIALKTNGAVIFNCCDHTIPSDDAVPAGSSLSLQNGQFDVSKISPGENGNSSLWPDNCFVREGSSVGVNYSDPAETDREIELNVTIDRLPTAPLMLSRAAGGVWNGTWVPYGISHGADIRFQYKQKSITVRYLENRPLSLNYHRALINELVTDPKTDYNGGGWTGADGGGLIDSSDEWIELVNTDDSPLSVSNYFLLYRTANGESVKELGVRYNPCFSKKSETLSNYNYIVLAPETGLANSASIGLYEGYPWLEGKLLDELDYGTDNFSGGDAWMNAPGGESSGKEDEAVVRIPNAVYDKRYRDVFRKGRASFAGMNSDGQPLLWARNVIGSFSNTVYLSEAGNTNSTLEVKVRNDLDSEVLTLTNYGIFFMGVINITNAEGAGNDGVLNVKNGIMSTVFYNNSINGKETTTRFAWAQEGWHLPEESPGVANVIMYPNPAVALRRTKIVFANLPDDAEVSVIDPFGNLVGKSNNFDKGYGFMSWEAELKKGIYVAVIRSGPRIVSKKLLVR